MPEVVYQFLRAVVSNYHKLSGLNNRNLFSHSFGDQKSKLQCWQSCVPPKAVEKFSLPLSGLVLSVFLGSWLYHSDICLRLHVTFCVYIPYDTGHWP
jgi:hypothetical protein